MSFASPLALCSSPLDPLPCLCSPACGRPAFLDQPCLRSASPYFHLLQDALPHRPPSPSAHSGVPGPTVSLCRLSYSGSHEPRTGAVPQRGWVTLWPTAVTPSSRQRRAGLELGPGGGRGPTLAETSSQLTGLTSAPACSGLGTCPRGKYPQEGPPGFAGPWQDVCWG